MAFLALLLTLAERVLTPPPPDPRGYEKTITLNMQHEGPRLTARMKSQIADELELMSDENDPWPLAHVSLADGDLDGALRLFSQKILQMEPTTNQIAQHHFFKGITLLHLKRYPDARVEARRSSDIAPALGWGQLLECRISFREKDFAGALDLCTESTKHAETMVAGFAMRGAVLAEMAMKQLGRNRPMYEEALASLEVALRHAPELPMVLRNKAVVQRRLGRAEEGLVTIEQALALDPDSADAQITKATLLKDVGKLDQATEIYRRLTLLKPLDGYAWSNLGDALELGGRCQEALQAYTTATLVDPLFGDGWYNRGHVLNSLGRFQEAVDALVQAAALNDADDEARYQLALALERVGDRAAALVAVDEALELNRENSEAQRLRRSLAAGVPSETELPKCVNA